MSRASQRRGLAPRAFAHAHSHWEHWITRVAARLALGDSALEQDLAQVGRITLWRSLSGGDSRMVRRQIRRRMYDYRRSRATRTLVA
jgi:hypothetical protein